MVEPALASSEEFYEKGLTLVTPSVKSLNYLANIMARAEATVAGAQEAIMLNSTGTPVYQTAKAA